MKMRLLLSSLLLLAVADAAHAKKFVPDTPVAAELPVEIFLPQQGIAVDTPPTGTGGGGAALSPLGYAIAGARAERTISREAMVQDLFAGYDFNTHFEQALRRKLTADISPAPKYQVLAQPLESYGVEVRALDDARGSAPPGRVLKIQGRWAMSYTLEKLYVRTSLYLVDRRVGKEGKMEDVELLARAYSFDVPLAHIIRITPEANSGRWHAIGAPEVQRLLDLAIDQSTDLLAYDFSPQGRARMAEKSGRRETSQFHGQAVDGRVFREEKDWYWAFPTIFHDTYHPSSLLGLYAANPEAAVNRAPVR